jgi:hypothetical protein
VKIPYAARPGGGLILLVLTCAVTLGFLLFGLSTPRLDRVWRLAAELKLGRKHPLSSDDFQLLQEALCDHKKLAEDFLEGRRLVIISAHRAGMVETGHAYLIREAKSPTLGVAVTALGGGKKEKTLEIETRTEDMKLEGIATSGRSLLWIPPPRKRCATLIEVRSSKGLFTVKEAGP